MEQLLVNQNYVGVVFIIVPHICFWYCGFKHKISLVSVDKVQYGANCKDQIWCLTHQNHTSFSLCLVLLWEAQQGMKSGRRAFTVTLLLFYHKAISALSLKVSYLSSTELWFWWSDFRFLYPYHKKLSFYFHHNQYVLFFYGH